MAGINTNRIRGIMAELRISGAELARMTGFSQTTISAFLNGGVPSLKLVKAISVALALTPDDISQLFLNGGR